MGAMGMGRSPFSRARHFVSQTLRNQRTSLTKCPSDLVKHPRGTTPKFMALTTLPSTMAQDTTFANTKLGQLPGWLLRRPKNPVDWFRAVSRSWWRWRGAYLTPRYANGAGVFQFVAAWATVM